MNNISAEQLAVALEELARLVRHTGNKQTRHMVKVGEGYAALEYMVFYDFMNVHALELRLCLTPPPQETGQNAVHTDDDDGNDGLFLTKIARLEAKIDGLDSDIASLIDMVRRG